MVYKLLLTLALFLLAATPSRADQDKTVSVRDHGARCDGQADDTAAFRDAIKFASPGGRVLVPKGNCVISDTLVVTAQNEVSIVGVGFGSQIFQKANKTLLSLQGVQAIAVKDLYLGSAATQPGTALIELLGSHRNTIENITMLGGYYGLHFFGSLLNTVIALRSGPNIGGFFGTTGSTNAWVFLERDSGKQISSNANTFLSPVLEGGAFGVIVQDLPDPSCAGCIRDGQGSIQILGGTMEGITQTALVLDRIFLPSSISGVHFEANGLDILINQAANVRLASILSLDGVQVKGAYTRNIQISDSILQTITTDTSVKRFQLQNITTDLNCTGVSGVSPSSAWDPSVLYVNIGLNCT